MRRIATLTGLVLLALCVLSVSSAAGLPPAGSLDPSFGSSGAITYNSGIAFPTIKGIALQPDGKIVVAGSSALGAGGSVLARYLPNGSPDPSFGNGGYVKTPAEDYVGAVALQPDGEIVVAGSRYLDTSTSALYSEFMVARYNPDGSLDTSFGNQGVTTTDVDPGRQPGEEIYESAAALAILPSGKIVAGGTTDANDSDSPYSWFSLAGYTANGSLDTTFGSGGVVSTHFTGGDELGGIVALQSGKIVATGAGYGTGHGEETASTVLARYRVNGSLDPSFGADGTGLVNANPYSSGPLGGPPALQHGKIIVAGTKLSRFTANGRLDTTFGRRGFARVWKGPASAVVVQADGKILTATGTTVGRFLPDGRRDKSFGVQGVVGLGRLASSLALQADGKVLAGGGTLSSWTLARLVNKGSAESAWLEWSRSRAPLRGAGLTSYDFGVIHAGASTSKWFKLGNAGLASSGTLAIKLTGSPAFSIAADRCTRKSVGAKLSCWVSVAYAPPGAGARDSATITATGEGGSTASLGLSGCSPSVGQNHAYWVNPSTGTVNRVPLDGCGATTLEKGQNAPVSVAVDSTHVYWVNVGDGTVNEVPIGGGKVTTLATGQSHPNAVAVDGTHVYWVNYTYSGGTVNEVPVGGGAVTTLASGQLYPNSVAVDGTNVYWATNDGTVKAVPVGGGAVTTLASGQGWPFSVAVDGAHVYWITYGSAGTVNEVPVGGGAVTTLASGQSYPTSMTTDGTHVYWVDGGAGTVNEVPVGGGSATTLASGQGSPESVAVDGTHVYWTNYYGGTVNSVPLGGGTVTTLARGPRGEWSLAPTLAIGP